MNAWSLLHVLWKGVDWKGAGGKFYIIKEIITKQSEALSCKVVNKPRASALFPTIIKSHFAFYASVSFPALGDHLLA